MKREIKFRAITTGTKQFVYGDLVHNAFDGVNRNLIIGIKPDGCYPIEVIPDSVGQFTGLTDKNGKEIYEHDILISKFGDKKPFEILFGEYQTYEEQVGSKSTSIGFYWNETDGEQVGFGKSIEGNMDAYEVVGNVFENHELLQP